MEERGTVSVHGLPAARLARLDEALSEVSGPPVLEVRTAAAGDELPAVLGRLEVVGDELRFTPRLPFRAGLGYRAVFDGDRFDGLTEAAAGTTPALELAFTPPAEESPPATRVAAVYPDTEVVPENLLRLYVWFSGPMRRHGVGRHIQLIDAATGEPVELPFVEIEEGLWDPSGRRLTLFFHPGRVKRGVGPNLAMGSPLRRGRRYHLQIDPGLRDAGGRPLAAGHRWSFGAGPADRLSPAPEAWRLTPPDTPAGSLAVDFDEPLDHGLLLRLLRVVDASGEAVAGDPQVEAGQTRWSFRPRDPWLVGSYRLRVSTALEDRAGNSLERRFDEATEAAREPQPPQRAWVELPFAVLFPEDRRPGR